MARRASKSSDSLSTMSASQRRAEIRRREKAASGLLRSRARLVERIRALDAEIASSGVREGGARFRNQSSLAEALRAVLDGKTMSVTEVAQAVQKAGYQTSAANFRTIVNACLIKKGNGFKRTDRGRYTAA